MSRFNLRRSDPAPAPSPTPAPAAAPSAAPAPARLILPVEAPPAAPAPTDKTLDVRLRLHSKLIDELDLSKLEKLSAGDMRQQVRNLVTDFVKAERLAFNTASSRSWATRCSTRWWVSGPSSRCSRTRASTTS
jgi:pilus assembly protein CpaF